MFIMLHWIAYVLTYLGQLTPLLNNIQSGVAARVTQTSTQQFLAKLKPIIQEQSSTQWTTALLHSGSIAHNIPNRIERNTHIHWILDNIYNPVETPLRREVVQFFQTLGLEWLTMYFKSYEMIVFSPRYQDVLSKAEHYLPKQGHILDIGSGPGTFSVFLANSSPNRYFTLFD